MNQALIFGEVLFDCFPDGTSVLGGAPFNVAWNLQGFGFSPITLSRIGEDRNASLVLEAMQDWGLDPKGIQRDSKHPTGLVNITLDGGSHSFSIEPNQAYDFIEPIDLMSLIGQDFPSGLVYHGSLALRSDVSRASFFELRKTSGSPCFLDLNLRAPWWKREDFSVLFSGATWVKLNDEELEIVVDRELRSDFDSMVEAAICLRKEYSLKAIIVTRGEYGAFLIDEHSTVINVDEVVVEKFVDTVGAGDAFSSVIIAGILKSWKWGQTLERAVSFSADVVGIRGATSFDREFYSAHLSKWE